MNAESCRHPAHHHPAECGLASDAAHDVGIWGVLARAPAHVARGLILIYRYTLSPLIGFHCRHLPTCSEYADEAFARHGFWAGGWITLARLARCHPFGSSGIDRVAPMLPERSRWYLPWRYGRWARSAAPPAP